MGTGSNVQSTVSIRTGFSDTTPTNKHHYQSRSIFGGSHQFPSISMRCTGSTSSIVDQSTGRADAGHHVSFVRWVRHYYRQAAGVDLLE